MHSRTRKLADDVRPGLGESTDDTSLETRDAIFNHNKNSALAEARLPDFSADPQQQSPKHLASSLQAGRDSTYLDLRNEYPALAKASPKTNNNTRNPYNDGDDLLTTVKHSITLDTPHLLAAAFQGQPDHVSQHRVAGGGSLAYSSFLPLLPEAPPVQASSCAFASTPNLCGTAVTEAQAMPTSMTLTVLSATTGSNRDPQTTNASPAANTQTTAGTNDDVVLHDDNTNRNNCQPAVRRKTNETDAEGTRATAPHVLGQSLPSTPSGSGGGMFMPPPVLDTIVLRAPAIAHPAEVESAAARLDPHTTEDGPIVAFISRSRHPTTASSGGAVTTMSPLQPITAVPNLMSSPTVDSGLQYPTNTIDTSGSSAVIHLPSILPLSPASGFGGFSSSSAAANSRGRFSTGHYQQVANRNTIGAQLFQCPRFKGQRLSGSSVDSGWGRPAVIDRVDPHQPVAADFTPNNNGGGPPRMFTRSGARTSSPISSGGMPFGLAPVVAIGAASRSSSGDVNAMSTRYPAGEDVWGPLASNVVSVGGTVNYDDGSSYQDEADPLTPPINSSAHRGPLMALEDAFAGLSMSVESALQATRRPTALSPRAALPTSPFGNAPAPSNTTHHQRRSHSAPMPSCSVTSSEQRPLCDTVGSSTVATSRRQSIATSQASLPRPLVDALHRTTSVGSHSSIKGAMTAAALPSMVALCSTAGKGEGTVRAATATTASATAVFKAVSTKGRSSADDIVGVHVDGPQCVQVFNAQTFSGSCDQLLQKGGGFPRHAASYRGVGDDDEQRRRHSQPPAPSLTASDAPLFLYGPLSAMSAPFNSKHPTLGFLGQMEGLATSGGFLSGTSCGLGPPPVNHTRATPFALKDTINNNHYGSSVLSGGEDGAAILALSGVRSYVPVGSAAPVGSSGIASPQGGCGSASGFGGRAPPFHLRTALHGRAAHAATPGSSLQYSFHVDASDMPLPTTAEALTGTGGAVGANDKGGGRAFLLESLRGVGVTGTMESRNFYDPMEGYAKPLTTNRPVHRPVARKGVGTPTRPLSLDSIADSIAATQSCVSLSVRDDSHAASGDKAVPALGIGKRCGPSSLAGLKGVAAPRLSEIASGTCTRDATQESLNNAWAAGPCFVALMRNEGDAPLVADEHLGKSSHTVSQDLLANGTVSTAFGQSVGGGSPSHGSLC